MPLRVTLQAIGTIYTMRTCTDATKAIIASQVAAQGSYRYDGFAPALEAAIWDALHERSMSLARERRMCAALGIEAPPNEYAIPECPGCGGEPHVAREGCHGNGGHAIVLAPGERVTTPRPRRYSRIDQMPVSMLARAIRDRQLAGPAPGVEV
jgi:hypothetical protein